MEVDRDWPPPTAQWTVRMLGRLEVVSKNGDRPKFRSKSCQALLAYLALNPGKEVSRFLLEETFWSQSDGDRQSQNLRRAVSDLRDALGGEHDRGSIILTQRDVVSANQALVVSDAIRFLELTTGGLNSSDEDLLHEAFNLYGGPLLAPLSEDWAYGYRLDYEEHYGQCVEMLCRIRVDRGVPKEAVRIARAAVLAAPTREDIHIALIHAYRSAGLEAEAIRQYEDLERMMDENWGESPGRKAKEALEGATPRERFELNGGPGSEVELSGGAMSLHSKYYIRRSADAAAEACIDRSESVVLIQGARQVGKSSVLARVLSYCRDRRVETMAVDLQTLGSSQLGKEETFYKTLAHIASIQLGQPLDLDSAWSRWLGSNMNLDSILGIMLERAPRRVCLAIDEADRLFGRPYANDFFGLLRSWHNRRALDPNGPWGKLTLILSYAADANLFITNVDQSPFNVGVLVPLADFTLDDLAELGARYSQLDAAAVDCVFRLTHGQPYVSSMAFRALKGGLTCKDLAQKAPDPDGPFGSHLASVLSLIDQSEEAVGEVKRVLSGEPAALPSIRHRLAMLGVLDSTRTQLRVPLYEPFLQKALA